MKEYIDPNKISTTEDIVTIVKFLLTNTIAAVDKTKVKNYEDIQRYLSEHNFGDGSRTVLHDDREGPANWFSPHSVLDTKNVKC